MISLPVLCAGDDNLAKHCIIVRRRCLHGGNAQPTVLREVPSDICVRFIGRGI